MTHFRSNWADKYKAAGDSWNDNWDDLTAFLEYPQAIRRLIYTTNIIKSFNASLRMYTRNKKVFPNDDTALKSIYLAALQISKKLDSAGDKSLINCIFISRIVFLNLYSSM